MDVSALRYPGVAGRGRSPLLKLQSDERLVAMVRRGNQGAFEALVARYNARLLSFCRHMLGSREDAEDVLQDVLTASYNALLADDRPINVRPWLYRIARNRCLNHLRRNRAIGVDSMDIHFSDNGASTADKVHEREEFRQLLHDIRDLPETQRTALVLREMDALSYEQIAEAMETTVSSVKSLLVRARVSLTEAAEARLLSCEEVREELAEIAEGLRRKQSASVRRHVKNCPRCEIFQGEMRKSSRALAALTPVAPLAFFHKLLFAHAATHSAGSAGAGVAGAAGAGGAGAAGAAGAAGGASSAGLVTAGVGAVATKAVAGIAAAALVTAGTVAIDHSSHVKHVGPSASALISRSISSGLDSAVGGSTRLGGAVGAGPGLATKIVPAAAAKVVHKKVVAAALVLSSTPAQSSKATHKVVTATKTSKTVASASTQTPPVSHAPGQELQGPTSSGPSSSSGAVALSGTPSSAPSTTGGSAPATGTTPAGTTSVTATASPLGATSAPSTTSAPGTASAPGTTAAPGTTSVTGGAPVTVTTTGTAPTSPATGTSTAPVGTSPGTTTAPTSTGPGTTTTPTGTTAGTSTSPTTTLPTGSITVPAGTPTTPVTETNPSDTSTDSTTTPVEP